MHIIKISSIGCSSCLIMNKILKEISNDFGIEITSYDYDFDFDEVEKYNVGNILPVIIFLDSNDKEITRLVGERSKDDIESIIKNYNYE